MVSSRARKEQKARERIQKLLEAETPRLELRYDPAELFYKGPVIRTDLTISSGHRRALAAAGKPIPAPVPCKFLLDTGADGCVVRHEIADKAGLKLINANAPIQGVGVDTSGRIYMGSIWFGFPSIKVPGARHRFAIDTQIRSCALGAVHLDGIIGRNVLNAFEMIYNGQTGKLSLRFLVKPQPTSSD